MLCCCVAALTGCTIFETDATQFFRKEPKFGTPHQMIPLWTDTVLHQIGNRARRGCGGRFMFYTAEGKESIRVDGALMVYVWDDTRSSRQRKPDRKYVFPADSLQNHFSKSKVGHSYSFWIPWDDAGSERAELTVAARFVGRNGVDITSPASKVILPGPVSMPEDPKTIQLQNGQDDSAGDVRQVSWDTDREEHSRSRRRLRSSEIHVGPGFVKRNQPAAADGYTASDLFAEPLSPSLSQSQDDAVVPPNRLRDTDRRDDHPDTDAAQKEAVSGKPSVQRAAHSLQSRFQARRAQAARQSAFAAQN